MKLPAALTRLVRYGAIGTIAAIIHASVLLGLGPWLPLSLVNRSAFSPPPLRDTSAMPC